MGMTFLARTVVSESTKVESWMVSAASSMVRTMARSLSASLSLECLFEVAGEVRHGRGV